MKQDYIRVITKILLWAAICITPLIFASGTQEVLELPKQSLFVILVSASTLFWLIETLIKSRLTYAQHKINYALLALPIVLLISALLSNDQYGGLVGWGVQISSSVISFVYLSLMVFLGLNVFDGIKDSFRTLFIFLIGGTIAIMLGTLQLAQLYPFPFDFTKSNAFNTFGTANGLGIFSGVLLLSAFGMLFALPKGTGRLVKIGLGIVCAIALIYLLALDYQTLWIALAIGTTLILVFGFIRRTSLKLTSVMWWVGLLLIAILMAVFNPSISDRFVVPTEVSLNLSVSQNIAIQALKTNSLFGSGPGTFAYDFASFKPQSLNNTLFWNIRFSKGGSEFTSWLAMVGILGIIALISLITAGLYRSVHSFTTRNIQQGESRFDRNILESSLLGSFMVLIISFFFYPFSFALWATFFLLILLILLFNRKEEIAHHKTILLEHSPQVSLIVAVVFLIAIVFNAGMIYGVLQRYRAERIYTKGVRTSDVTQAQTFIEKATRINPYNDLYWRDLAALSFNQFINESQQPQSQERDQRIQNFLNQALSASNEASQLNSQNSFTWSLRATIYRNLIGVAQGADEFAFNTIKEAIMRDPTNPILYTEQGRIHLAKLDLEALGQITLSQQDREKIVQDAITSFNKAIELKRDYAPALFQSALLFDRLGERQEAINRMEINKALEPENTGIAFQLGTLYYKARNFDRAQAEFERAIALDENFSNARYFLGIIYDFRGRRLDAIAEFEKIAQLNPDNPTVSTILTNLRRNRPALGTSNIGGETFLPLESQTVPIPTTNL